MRPVKNPKRYTSYWAEYNASPNRRAYLKKYCRNWYRRVRAEALIRYGGRCVCCKEDDLRFLTFDHIEPVGKRGKRADRTTWARELKAGLIDSNIRVLCWNCNCGRAANGGVCPHKEPK